MSARAGWGKHSIRLYIVILSFLLALAMLVSMLAYVLVDERRTEEASVSDRMYNMLVSLDTLFQSEMNDLKTALWQLQSEEALLQSLSASPREIDSLRLNGWMSRVETIARETLANYAHVGSLLVVGRQDFAWHISIHGKSDGMLDSFTFHSFASNRSLSPYFFESHAIAYYQSDDSPIKGALNGYIDRQIVLSYALYDPEGVISGALLLTIEPEVVSALLKTLGASLNSVEVYDKSDRPVYQDLTEQGGVSVNYRQPYQPYFTWRAWQDYAGVATLPELLLIMAGCLLAWGVLVYLCVRRIFSPLQALEKAMTGQARPQPIVKKLRDHSSMRQSLYRYLLLSVCVPALLNCLLTGGLLFERRYARLEDATGEALDTVLLSVQSQLNNARRLSDLTRDALEQAREGVRIDELFFGVYSTNRNVLALQVFDREGKLTYTRPQEQNRQALLTFNADMFRKMRSGDGSAIYLGPPDAWYPSASYMIGTTLTDEQGQVDGMAILLMDQSMITSPIEPLRLMENGFYLLTRGDQALGSRQSFMLGRMLESRSVTGMNDTVSASLDGERYQLRYRDVTGTDMRLISVLPINDVEKNIYRSMMPLAGLFALLVLACLLLAYPLAAAICRPLTLLSQRLLSMRSGVWEPVPLPKQSELATLLGQYNLMVSRLDELLEENYRVRLRESESLSMEREARLKALQQQINPHFLYNTLETIKWMAYSKGATEAYDMIVALGNFFYGVMSRGDIMLPLSDEMNCLDSYIYIQSRRFANRFVILKKIQPETLGRLTLKLTLQPLVENAILHGMADRETGGEIVISSFMDGDDLVLEVCDNGAGMTEKQLEQLRERLEDEYSSEKESIGVVNVSRRLRLSFGRRAGLTISSEPGRGTRVTVRIPQKDSERIIR